MFTVRFLLVGAFLFTGIVKGQPHIDSLKKVLMTAEGPQKIHILTTLCSEYAYKNADSARMYGQQALKLLSNEPTAARADVLHHLAITHQVQSNYEEALRLDEEALAINISLGDSLRTANSYNNIGLIYDEQGRFQKAIEFYLKAENIYRQLKDELQLASVLVNLGVVYKGMNDYINSAKNYREALDTFVRLKHSYGIAVCQVNLGSVFLMLQQYDSALAYSQQAKQNFNRINFSRFEAVAIGNAGIALGKLGRSSEAEVQLRTAIRMHEQNNSVKELSYCYLKFAEFYRDRNQNQQAQDYAKRALAASQQAGVLQQVADSNLILADLFALQGDTRSAFAFQRAYLTAHDSLFRMEQMKQVRELQIQFETERKERALAEAKVTLAEQNMQIRQRNNQLMWLALGLVSVLLTGFVFYRNQKIKQQRLQLKAALAEAKSLNALQEERLRISQELHDNIGSQLTFVSSSIALLAGNGANAALEDLRKITNDTIRELRKTVWLINKQSATLEEFVIKLRDYVSAGAVPPIHFESNIEDPIEIKASTANHLFRVVQEAVNNALKHAGASALQIKISSTQRDLEIQIIDNGKGFDTSSSSAGFGLRNMRKRMEAIGGVFQLTSQPGHTAIVVRASL